MKEYKFVLDSSGVIRSNLDFSCGGYAIPNSVMAELTNRARDAVEQAIASGKVKPIEPSDSSLSKVKAAARETGDLNVLSEADLDALALALEHKIPVISDDYAIQNTAAKLGVEFKATFHEGIRKSMKWIFKCTGCRREYDGKTTVCSVCGSPVKRTGQV